ncbi:hypothetical protein H8959_013003, partial [Pygathrix nigripes]
MKGDMPRAPAGSGIGAQVAEPYSQDGNLLAFGCREGTLTSPSSPRTVFTSQTVGMPRWPLRSGITCWNQWAARLPPTTSPTAEPNSSAPLLRALTSTPCGIAGCSQTRLKKPPMCSTGPCQWRRESALWSASSGQWSGGAEE